VTASAGSGKTKILVDHVLNLLICKESLDSILCITYTNAAAAEMKERLRAQLKTLDFSKLTVLLGRSPNENEIKLAQNLYKDFTEKKPSIRICTIHSFCTEILSFFSLDVGIYGNIEILKNGHKIIQEIQDECLTNTDDKIFKHHFSLLSKTWQFDKISSVLLDLASKRYEFAEFLKKYDVQKYENFLKKKLEKTNFNEKFNENIVNEAASIIAQKALLLASDIKFLENIKQKQYYDAFLTTHCTVRKKILTNDVIKQFPNLEVILQEQAEILYNDLVQQKTEELINKTQAIIELGKVIFQKYQDYKKRENSYDFEDLLIFCNDLLSKAIIDEKLKQSIFQLFPIKHIFLDEAQDTSPQQWQIVLKLVEAFFNPESSIFVVGDVKQSIYSFQGAKPWLFYTLEPVFQKIIEGNGGKWQRVSLVKSYRTAPAILEIIDKVFEKDNRLFSKPISSSEFEGASGEQNRSVLDIHEGHWGESQISPKLHENSSIEATNKFAEEIELRKKSNTGIVFQGVYERHLSARTEKGWLQVINVKKAEKNEEESYEEKIAQKTAEYVWKLIEQKVFLPSVQRVVTPEDILILTRRRSEVTKLISEKLKQLNIKTAPIDRIKIEQSILWFDLLAFVRFLVYPYDDYNLACLLKSPFGPWISEEQLFNLCFNRTSQIFYSEFVKNSALYTYYNESKKSINTEELFDFFYRVLAYVQPLFYEEFGSSTDTTFSIFLEEISTFFKKEGPNLQKLLIFLENLFPDGKNAQRQGGVRFMTVHGSKGLQAPIVFIVDQLSNNILQKENFIWFSEENDNFFEDSFLLMPSEFLSTPPTLQLRQEARNKLLEENRRLLYVAMTRAQDGLCSVGNSENEESWHQIISNACKNDFWGECIFGKVSEAEQISQAQLNTQINRLPSKPISSSKVEGAYEAQNRSVLDIHEGHWGESVIPPKPHEDSSIEATNKFAEEIELRKKSNKSIIKPKRPFAKKIKIQLPKEQIKKERGILTHFLIEKMCEENFEESKAEDLILKKAKIMNINPSVIKLINFAKIFKIREKNEFFWLKNGKREVSLCHCGKIFRLDHLYLDEEKAIIIEVKTSEFGINALPHIIKEQYNKQINQYCNVVKAIFPEKYIQSYFLWIFADEVAFQENSNGQIP
jgi:ATP-dependent helicase/nuclease subunit A